MASMCEPEAFLFLVYAALASVFACTCINLTPLFWSPDQHQFRQQHRLAQAPWHHLYVKSSHNWSPGSWPGRLDGRSHHTSQG